MPQPWLSVVVPAYNEEETIAVTLTALRDWLEARGRPYEILVVDNASEDRTVERAESHEAEVRVLRNDVNRGKGFSVRRGMLEASGALRLLCDADCAASLVSLDRMIEAMQHSDVAIGSRIAPGADVGRTQPIARRLVGWPFIALTRLLLSEPTRDIYCGFKLWRGATAQAVFSRQTLDGWVFDAEVLALARRLGFRLREVGLEALDQPDPRAGGEGATRGPPQRPRPARRPRLGAAAARGRVARARAGPVALVLVLGRRWVEAADGRPRLCLTDRVAALRDLAHVEPRLEVVRLLLEHLLQHPGGLLEPAALVERPRAGDRPARARVEQLRVAQPLHLVRECGFREVRVADEPFRRVRADPVAAPQHARPRHEHRGEERDGGAGEHGAHGATVACAAAPPRARGPYLSLPCRRCAAPYRS
jgi:dolichyl-phosphate beta-glucosyltransferase